MSRVCILFTRKLQPQNVTPALNGVALNGKIELYLKYTTNWTKYLSSISDYTMEKFYQFSNNIFMFTG